MSYRIRLIVAGLLVCLVLKSATNRPELSERDVLSAAARTAGAVAPGEIIVLFPSNAGPDILASYELNSEGRFKTTLGETRVWFDGFAAPVVYTVRGQVGAVVPYEISNQKTTQLVLEYQGLRSLPVVLPVVDRTPALFTLDSSGKGQAAMLNETGCCNSTRNPAARGSIVVLYATGEGQTKPPGVTGRISAFPRISEFPAPQRAVRVTIGGIQAAITFAGEAPDAVSGLLQVNVRVPRRAPAGDAVPVMLQVGDSRSPDGLTMAVRSAVQRVLIIESEPGGRNRFGKVLAGAGYDVLIARNGAAARTQAEAQPVDLFIFSLRMPQQEALQAIAALRSARPLLKIIALSRALDPDALKSADLLGAQAVFTPATSSSAVLRKVHELLRSRPVPYAAHPDGPLFPLNRSIPR